MHCYVIKEATGKVLEKCQLERPEPSTIQEQALITICIKSFPSERKFQIKSNDVRSTISKSKSKGLSRL
jgi:hypothetical protein